MGIHLLYISINSLYIRDYLFALEYKKMDYIDSYHKLKKSIKSTTIISRKEHPTITFVNQYIRKRTKNLVLLIKQPKELESENFQIHEVIGLIMHKILVPSHCKSFYLKWIKISVLGKIIE